MKQVVGLLMIPFVGVVAMYVIVHSQGPAGGIIGTPEYDFVEKWILIIGVVSLVLTWVVARILSLRGTAMTG